VAGAAVYQGGVVCGGFQGQYVVHGGCQGREGCEGDPGGEGAVGNPAAWFVVAVEVGARFDEGGDRSLLTLEYVGGDGRDQPGASAAEGAEGVEVQADGTAVG
jgi:hypothetical protein